MLKKDLLFRATLVLAFFFVLFVCLARAQGFLKPVAFAAIFAMLLQPVCRWLEQRMSRTWASLLSVLLFVLVFGGLLALLSGQMADFAERLQQVGGQFTEMLDKYQKVVAEKFGISPEEQKKLLESGDSAMSGLKSMAQGFVMGLFGTMADLFLTLVYMFLFLMYRTKFRRFIQKLTPDDASDRTDKVITEGSKVAYQYLFGRLILIVILSVLYTVGLLVVGVQNAFFFALLAAVVSIIPYIGNIVGGGLPLATALISGDSGQAIGVIAVFTVAQMLENYVLEPLVVGKRVELNALFTIVIIVVGGSVWGVAGTILAIPYLAILKIIFDHVPPLHPYAYLIGDQSGGDSTDDAMQRVKDWFRKRFR
ncbi:Predicted PurR-regulated permease PerM [Catalinimonas alkaloidigena]|uniref:Predicted PurR-regulated permease PerM n=1 Tax=Catalinimonas alkaloidigena TaxID=1075417 RepID=A0A1G9F977_9BACT|nr:AI-2E family transporter [Catalinimonas alkaloidigena]SDK84972.1 Predicted PurR-regulated permease PerM [Catalinimonas alkaloidigena]